jgi:hypothetical protein
MYKNGFAGAWCPVSEGNLKPVIVLNNAGGCARLRVLFTRVINSWMKVWMVGFCPSPVTYHSIGEDL